MTRAVTPAGSRRARPLARVVVKRARVLDDIDADVPYGETRLARRAPGARKRLVVLLALFVAGFSLEAYLSGSVLWLLPGLFAAGAALALRKERLGGLVATALLALLATLLPLGILGVARPADGADVVALVACALLGVAALPDVVLLARDAELQHAYGLWAQRSD